MKALVCVTVILFAAIIHALAVDKPLGTFSASGAGTSSIYSNPNLRGVLLRVSWSQIETAPGTFNFTTLDNQVALVTAQGKSWSLAVLGGGLGSPAWLTDPASSGGLGASYISYSFRGVAGYRLPLIWDATVQDRLAQLATKLAERYNTNASLKLVYVTQMTANGIEGHLQGVTMSTLIAAGTDQDGDSDVDAADFSLNWIAASKATAHSFALAFTSKALAFEVHDVNGTSTIPETIINDLWNDATLGQRVGAAMWWISGKTTYQTQLVNVLSAFPGDIYGQVIGPSYDGPWVASTSYSQGTFRMPVNPPATQRYRYEATTGGVSGTTEPIWPTTINATVSDGTVVWTCRDSQFPDGDYTQVFTQAKALGMRYIEPWETEFSTGTSSANGQWNAALADFNSWADATFNSGNTSPTITSIANQTTTTGVAVGPLSFTVGDAETAVASLSVTGSSSNTTVLPTANITFGGSGASRSVTLTPASGQTGTSTVTLTVSDGALSTQTSFTLTVNAGNTAPTITSIANQTTAVGVAVGPLSFTVGDAETAVASLSVTGASSNTTVLPAANIVFGGSGASRTVTLTPASGQSGTSTVTLTVSDGSLTATTSFTLTAGNTAPTITAIPNQTTTTGVAVGPLAFTVGDAETAAASLIVVRISSNTTLVPTANIVFGGSGANRTVTVTPAAGQTGTANIIIRVSDGSLLAQATFTLTVNSGNTAPTITSLANQTTSVGTAVGPLSFTVGDAETAVASLSVTGASSNTTLLPTANITFGGSGASRTVTLTPASGQSGTSTVTLTVSDGSLTAQTSFTFTVSSGRQTVTSLSALHQNGQTYLTWNEVADSTATYRIYRSATAFTSTAHFNSGNLIGTASADSSFDTRLSALRGTNYYYRITAAGPDLTSTQGVFVFTPAADGAAYYAVTAVVSSVEQLAVSAGQNTTATVSEIVAMPEPVYQRSVTVSSRTVETYVHWVSATETALYPAMGNQNSVAHHLGLVRNGTASTHSLLIRPHARQSSFLSTVTGTSDTNEWVLTLDDWMPNSIENTFWYGYHEGFDINTGLPLPTSGIVHDYTTRRAKWEIEWALRTLPIDLNRVYLTGHSMGGIGSTFLGILLREKIAAIWTTSAKYDFSFLNDPNAANIWNSGSNERANSGDILWGTVATNLPCSEGLPVYDRLNANYLVAAFKADNLPVFIAFNGKNDPVVGWAEKLGFYSAMNANKHGGMFFWDSGVHNRTGGEFVPEQDINVLNRYRLDQSYPAFSNSSVNGNPGNGSALNGDAYGTMNGNLDWDTSSIVDTASQWQIKLNTTALTSTSGTVAAPTSATVDVTPRRLQTFPHDPGSLVHYEVRDLSQTLLQSGLVTADADGLYTVPAATITSAGTTLTLMPVTTNALTVTGTAGNLSLQWPTTPGVRYQVEWSSDLTQWFAASSESLATTTGMTWSDDGSSTGSSVSATPRRFYRLRISE